MARPTINDNGSAVTLDLHGARVAEAELLALRAVGEAALRGRGTIRIIHGHSTTGAHNDAPTIKSAILDLLEDGAFDQHVASELRGDGHVLLGLSVAGRRDTRRIHLSDIS